MKLTDLFQTTPSIPPTKLRQEIFSLGGRHLGDPLAGALQELKDPKLTPERRSLLRAVVVQLAPGKHADVVEGGDARPRSASRLGDAAYLGIFLGSALWVVVVVRSMLT